MLIYFVRHRRDLPFPWMFWLFGSFILGCGTTHLMEVIVTYHPLYWLAGAVKVFTAGVSLVTVGALIPLTPRVMMMRSPESLEQEVQQRSEELLRANQALEMELQQRLRVEQELRESEARFRQMADAMPQMVWYTKPDGYVEYFNQRWYDYTGWSEEESLADQWTRAVHEEDRDRARACWAEAVQNGKSYQIEYRLLDGQRGYRWFLGRALPVRDEEGKIVRWFGTCTDIQDQKQTEESLRRAQEELHEAKEELENRVRERTTELHELNEVLRRSNRELEEFAYVASHDLQEPLRKIQSFSDRLLAKHHRQLDEQGRDYLDRMRTAAARMQRLINDLLMFSRVTTKGQPVVEVDLKRLIGEVVSDLENRIQETGGKVEVGDIPRVHADLTQMRQLFQNLIGNALKFHRPGVAPVIEVRGREIPNGEETAFPMCEIVVRDNGIGFEEAYRERIFQVFQRLHGRQHYEGTGVGLAICRKIVERHGGSITASSVPGKGATFTILLPVRPESR